MADNNERRRKKLFKPKRKELKRDRLSEGTLLFLLKLGVARLKSMLVDNDEIKDAINQLEFLRKGVEEEETKK